MQAISIVQCFTMEMVGLLWIHVARSIKDIYANVLITNEFTLAHRHNKIVCKNMSTFQLRKILVYQHGIHFAVNYYAPLTLTSSKLNQ